MSPTQQRLLEAFKNRAVAFGKFTLASGKESTYYINSKKAIFHSEVVGLLGDMLYEMTKDLNIDAAGTFGGHLDDFHAQFLKHTPGRQRRSRGADQPDRRGARTRRQL